MIEDGGLAVPHHFFGSNELRHFISLLSPEISKYLSEEVIDSIYSKIQERYSLQIDAAVKGIHSDEEMADYMEPSGLLNEIRIDKMAALEKIKGIDYLIHFFEPLDKSVNYNPAKAPQSPVRLPAKLTEQI